MSSKKAKKVSNISVLRTAGLFEYIKKGWCPTGAQGSPSELNFLRLMEELNPEPFDRRKF